MEGVEIQQPGDAAECTAEEAPDVVADPIEAPAEDVAERPAKRTRGLSPAEDPASDLASDTVSDMAQFVECSDTLVGTTLGTIDLARALLSPDTFNNSIAAVLRMLEDALHVSISLPGMVLLKFRDAAGLRVQPDAEFPNDIYVYTHQHARAPWVYAGHVTEFDIMDVDLPETGAELVRCILRRLENSPKEGISRGDDAA